MFERLAIADVFVYQPKRHADGRGDFAETFSKALLEPMTGPLDWVQDNHARTKARGVLRGLHLQIAPHAQDKLLRCVRGAVLDVAVDVRSGSPTFGQHVSTVLSAENGAQVFVPKGFAHGYLTLETDCEVIYKVTDVYDPACERGVLWNDPALGIDWGLPPDDITLSERDHQWPELARAGTLFA